MAYRRKGRLLANPLYQNLDPDVMSGQSWSNVRYKWFSLHAAVSIEGTNSAALRQLFHYGARSSVNLSLLSDPDDPGAIKGFLQSTERMLEILSGVRSAMMFI